MTYHIGTYKEQRLVDVRGEPFKTLVDANRAAQQAYEREDEEAQRIAIDLLAESLNDETDAEPPLHLLYTPYVYAPVKCPGKRRCTACHEYRAAS